MLTSIRIQNFRSIRDASVKLGQVNLFIGPNNSGKSNFLKGINFLANALRLYPNISSNSDSEVNEVLPRFSKDTYNKIKPILNLKFNTRGINLHVPTTPEVGLIFPFSNREKISLYYDPDSETFVPEEFRESGSIAGIVKGIQNFFLGSKVYKLEPAVFELSTGLSDQPQLDANGANIASFLNTLSQNHESRFGQLKRDFAICVGNLISVSTPPDPNTRGNLKLKFFDSNNNAYWAEEVSEGVLYFLALLCIIHQPDPPKLLLLEEPEKGIHPRRIKEVMDFIFELAHLRDIQIILTSHSPYVVDHFTDIPECISVFDRENDETVIRNAADIITETNATLKQPIRYSDALGEHWVSGFLGGVPV